MDAPSILGFATVSVALACTPGADWAYCITAGLGRHRISPAVAGLCAGYLMHTLLVVAGVAALVAGRPRLLAWLSVIGAGYLLWLGVSTARSWRSARFSAAPAARVPATVPAVPARVPALAGTASPDSHRAGAAIPADGTSPAGPEDTGGTGRAADRRNFLRGLGTSGTNPKALLLYLALIPQFIGAGPLPVPVQTGIFGLSHLLVSALVYSGVALGARRLLRSRPAAARVVTLASGAIMIGLGTVLLAEQLPALLR